MPGEKISRQEDYIKMNEHEISSKKKRRRKNWSNKKYENINPP
jgi:hypothetical protein